MPLSIASAKASPAAFVNVFLSLVQENCPVDSRHYGQSRFRLRVILEGLVSFIANKDR
jgi:hypothetical protein